MELLEVNECNDCKGKEGCETYQFSMKRYKKPFSELSAEEQTTILNSLI